MHIVLIVEGEEYGGAEQSIRNLVEHSNSNIRFTLLGKDCTSFRALSERLPDVPSTALLNCNGRFATVVSFSLALRQLCPHWVQITLCNPGAAMGAQAAALLLGYRLVVIEQLVRPVGGRRRQYAKRILSRFASDHVAVGCKSARAVERLVPLPTGSVRAIYNGVPTSAAGSGFADQVLAGVTGPIIGCIARLSPQKALDILIQALPSFPCATLVLVGEGNERSFLEALAISLQVHDRVIFTGWQNHPQDFLSHFDVFALPSNEEAFPLTIVEAMLARVPVVANNVGSVSEAIEHGVTGVLLENNTPEAVVSALSCILENRMNNHTLTEAAYARAVKHYTATAMASRYEQMWQHPRGRLLWTRSIATKTGNRCADSGGKGADAS